MIRAFSLCLGSLVWVVLCGCCDLDNKWTLLVTLNVTAKEGRIRLLFENIEARRRMSIESRKEKKSVGLRWGWRVSREQY